MNIIHKGQPVVINVTSDWLPVLASQWRIITVGCTLWSYETDTENLHNMVWKCGHLRMWAIA